MLFKEICYIPQSFKRNILDNVLAKCIVIFFPAVTIWYYYETTETSGEIINLDLYKKILMRFGSHFHKMKSIHKEKKSSFTE